MSQNHYLLYFYNDRYRGILVISLIEKNKCCGCSSCYNSCPKNSITMTIDEEGFLYPSINQGRCIDCGLCEKICPMLDNEKRDEPVVAFAAKCKDDELLFYSSSGGVFSILAMSVLDKGGVVFGATFSSNFKEVYHTVIDNSGELSKLRTSKYVQSRIGESYQRAKKFLDEGTEVLFSGVPCQIYGLKKYLRKEYKNLTCIDIVCHGVPSPELWKKYLINLEQTYHGIIIDVNFRQKKYHWKNLETKSTSDVVEIFELNNANPYMQMFLRNFSLRPSCYSCQAKVNGSDADITLGDFWGIQNVAPEMENGRGVSAVLLNTERGRRLFDKVLDSIDTKEVSYEDVKKYNSSIYKSCVEPQGRFVFFTDMNNLTFDELVAKYCNQKKEAIEQKKADTILWKIARQIVRGRVLNNKFEYGIRVVIKKMM